MRRAVEQIAFLLLLVPAWAEGQPQAPLQPAEQTGEQTDATRPELSSEATSAQLHEHKLSDEILVNFLNSLTETVSDTSEDIATHSYYTQVFITIIVGLFGMAVVFLQVKSEGRYERERGRLEKQIESGRNELRLWREETVERLNRDLAELVLREVEEAVVRKIELLFRDKYERSIEKSVAEYSREVLLQTPEARGLMVSRLRRMVDAVGSSFNQSGQALDMGVSNSLASAVQDWHTLGQLFSPDYEQLEKGLLAVRSNPFLEATPRLKRLRLRYADVPQLVPLIDEALKRVEELKMATPG